MSKRIPVLSKLDGFIYSDAFRRDATIWLILFAACSLLPLYGSALLLYLDQKPQHIYDYTSRGELTLLAASLLGSAAFIIVRPIPTRFPRLELLGAVGILLLIFSALTFAAALLGSRAVDTEASNQILNNYPPRSLAISWISFALFILSLAFYLLAMKIDYVVTRQAGSRDVMTASAKKLADDYHKTSQE